MLAGFRKEGMKLPVYEKDGASAFGITMRKTERCLQRVSICYAAEEKGAPITLITYSDPSKKQTITETMPLVDRVAQFTDLAIPTSSVFPQESKELEQHQQIADEFFHSRRQDLSGVEVISASVKMAFLPDGKCIISFCYTTDYSHRVRRATGSIDHSDLDEVVNYVNKKLEGNASISKVRSGGGRSKNVTEKFTLTIDQLKQTIEFLRTHRLQPYLSRVTAACNTEAAQLRKGFLFFSPRQTSVANANALDMTANYISKNSTTIMRQFVESNPEASSYPGMMFRDYLLKYKVLKQSEEKLSASGTPAHRENTTCVSDILDKSKDDFVKKYYLW